MYSTEKIILLNGDCLEQMKHIEPCSIDLILCDLPYGKTKNKWDTVIPFEELWKHYNRIIKQNSPIILFGQGTFFIDLVNSNKKMFKYDLIWNKILKSGFLNCNVMPLRSHENIGVFYNKKPTYNPQKTEGNKNHKKGYLCHTKQYKNNNYGKYTVIQSDCESTLKYPTSILNFEKPHPSICLHPTQKPLELIEYLIKSYSNENDLVLDNCMGSGTTGVACKKLNRRFIGIELDEKYFNIAKSRIDETINPLF